MFGQIWNNGTIRKYVIYFGTIFSEIYLQRDDSNNQTIQTLKVPINYGPKEKFLARLEGNPDLDRPIAIQLPRMSFEIGDMYYDASRKQNSLQRISITDSTDLNKRKYQYAPIPYNFDFELNIMVKNAEDGTRIVEQILPFFTPDFTATLNLNPEMDATYDIPLILNSVKQIDTYEGDFIQRRAIIWTLNFTLKGWLFGPTRTGSIIKEVEINSRIPNSNTTMESANTTNTPVSIRITVTPGLTANGEPTSNSELTIDKSLIESTDNYGYIIDFMENIYNE